MDVVVVESLANGGFAALEDEGILIAARHAGCRMIRQGKYCDGPWTYHSGSVVVLLLSATVPDQIPDIDLP